MYVEELFTLGSQKGPSTLVLVEDLCKEHSKKNQCSETGIHRVYSTDRTGNVLGIGKEEKHRGK